MKSRISAIVLLAAMSSFLEGVSTRKTGEIVGGQEIRMWILSHPRSDHADNLLAGGAAHNRIVDQDHRLPSSRLRTAFSLSLTRSRGPTVAAR